MGMINDLGSNLEQIWQRLCTGDTQNLQPYAQTLPGSKLKPLVGMVSGPLPAIPRSLARFDCRNNALLLAAYLQIADVVQREISRWHKQRVGIVIGSSTSGIAATEDALRAYQMHGQLPDSYHYNQHEMGSAAQFLASMLDLHGPAYTISTACSSSAKAFASGRNLLTSGLCDAVLVGGVDTLCLLTLSGFISLEAMSSGICNPMSRNRDGINIGEGAALFLLTREHGGIALLGVGESSDAHHITAPEPTGRGAESAMRKALADAKLLPQDIAYVNLHGTATPHNDAMESLAINRVFGPNIPCSSTKPLVGHTLGAAGAIEVGFCWLILSQPPTQRLLPPHRWDGQIDDSLPPISLISVDAPQYACSAVTQNAAQNRCALLSNSFAFGGSNCSVIIGDNEPCMGDCH
jgi:3-oxoacyl-[acyl-carrier-protein] synthase-1